MSSLGVDLQNYLIPLEEIIHATENFSDENCIGGGGFGHVYIGKLSEKWQNRTAAIKRLDKDSYQGKREFHNEIEKISTFHHENIISFIGYSDDSDEMIIVSDYAMNGSLDQHIQDSNKWHCITWTRRLKICLEAARGLNYLHSGCGEHNRVIHRDVKSSNILLDENFVVKICDFGLSRSHHRNQPESEIYTQVAGTQFYMDPSYQETGILHTKSDVYSFGVVLFEMLSGMLAYCRRSTGDDGSQYLITLVRKYYGNQAKKLIDPCIKEQIYIPSFDTFVEVAYQCMSFESTERPTMEEVIERIEKALNIQVQENIAALIVYVMKDLRFSERIPVAAFSIYRCLVHWKCFEDKTTPVFDQIVEIIHSAIEDGYSNNHKIAYWLSFSTTLIFLIEKSLDLKSAKGIIHSSTVEQVEAKYPALLFIQKLKAYVEKMYRIIRDNLKEELKSLPRLCAQAPPTFNGVIRSPEYFGRDSEFNHWQSIIDRLNILLNTMKENYVPSVIVQKILGQNFSYINVELFNSLLSSMEFCTLINAEYVKGGLAILERWCCETNEEYAGSTWNELQHIRQAIALLVKRQKEKITYDEITNDICPILSIGQMYRICVMYSDDKYGNQSVSSDLLSSITIAMMREELKEDLYLLKDSSSIPLFVYDVSTSLQIKDFANVLTAAEVADYQAFHILYN